MAKISTSDYSDKDSLVRAIIDAINEHDVRIGLLATEAPVATEGPLATEGPVAVLASPAPVVLEKPAVIPASVTLPI